MKDVAGYDLTKLLVGSEGTLAIITEATLKLIPPPKFKKTMLAMYKDIYDAARTVSKIIENRIIPATWNSWIIQRFVLLMILPSWDCR